jgi:hypothetical protein
MQNSPPETERLTSAEPASGWASLVRGLLTILIFAILFFLLQKLTFLFAL